MFNAIGAGAEVKARLERERKAREAQAQAEREAAEADRALADDVDAKLRVDDAAAAPADAAAAAPADAAAAAPADASAEQVTLQVDAKALQTDGELTRAQILDFFTKVTAMMARLRSTPSLAFWRSATMRCLGMTHWQRSAWLSTAAGGH